MKYNRLSCRTILCCLFYSILVLACDQSEQNDRIERLYPPGLKRLGTLKPRHATEISRSPWGIQAGTLDADLLERAAEIGVKWTRLGASWKSIERQKGVYDWSETDRAFDAVLKIGITPFVTLGTSNALYSKPIKGKDPKLVAIYGQNPAPPIYNKKAMTAWLRFVRTAVQRYKDRIQYWEVWNEPNHHHYWGAKPDGRDYGRLLKATAKVIREVDPEAIILGGSMAGLSPKFMDDFLSQGTEGLVDIITYHNYGAIPETRIYKAVEAWKIIENYNPVIELWQGECGYPSHSSTRDYRGTSPWGLNIQAKWLLRQAFTDIFFCRASMSNYFKLVHNRGRGDKPDRKELRNIDHVLGNPERGGSRVKSVGVNEKCLLENPGLNPKPAYFAYQNLCTLLDSRYERVEIKHEIKIKEAGIFYGIGPEDDSFPSIPLVASFTTGEGHYLIAYWLPWHPQEIIRPAVIDLVMPGIGFSDPVLVDLLTGQVFGLSEKVHRFGSGHFSAIPLADFPWIIIERDEIQYQ
ncbi:hypothetical protein BVY01_01795 [bacterium I07]|nr:hypothetical protein BVY01_01795 [bacterium I07]